MLPLALAFLLAAPVSAASIKTPPGKAGFGPSPRAWTQAVGYLLASQPNLSSTLKLDAGALKAGDPKTLKALEPLVWAIQSLGHEDPLEFLRLEPGAQAETVAEAVSAAGKELSLQAQALLQAEPEDTASLRETAQGLARLRFAYERYLPSEVKDELAAAHDAARAKLASLASQKAASMIEAASAYWLSQSPPDDMPAQQDSLPSALARRLANLLDVVPPGTREFSDALQEMLRVSAHFADPEARRIIADALLAKVRAGARFSASSSASALKDLAAALKDEPAPLQDAGLREKIVRELAALDYDSLDTRLVAMRAVWALGLGSASPRVRRLAHETLDKQARSTAARDDEYYAEKLAEMSTEVEEGLGADAQMTAPTPLKPLSLPVGPPSQN